MSPVFVEREALMLHGPISSAPLAGGDTGIAQTIAQMRSLVDAALRDSSIIRLATDIVRNVQAFDDPAEAQAIYQWVLQNIRFTKDPVGKEKLYPPAELLQIRAGDCDDIAMIMATLLMAVGYPARFITVAANPTDPRQFSHVYTEAEVAGQWIPMDAAHANASFGVGPSQIYRKRAWSLTDSSYQDLSGLGTYQRVRARTPGMGDAALDAAIAAAAADVPSAIAAATGNPYATFMTPYTPYSSPAGYTAAAKVPTATASLSSTPGMLIVIGIFGVAAVFMFSKSGRR